MNMKKLILLSSLMFASFIGFSQEEEENQSNNYSINEGWSASINIAPTISAGDLSTAKFGDLGFEAGLSIQKAINPSLDWRFKFSGGMLKGSKSEQYFKGNFINLNTTLQFNYLTFINPEKFAENALKPYLYFGIGVNGISSERFSSNDVSIEKYGRTSMISVPFGLGLEYTIGDKLSLSCEAGLNLLRTDMMDAWESNTKDQRFTEASNKTFWMLFGIKDSDDNLWQDMYGTISFSVKYKFDFSKSAKLAPSSNSQDLIK